jgi:hypothetical protein
VLLRDDEIDTDDSANIAQQTLAALAKQHQLAALHNAAGSQSPQPA